MAKSKETFNKKEKEKKRLKKLQDKREKMEERKANSSKKSLDDMMAYIDEDGNITSTPPDPKKKKIFNIEDIPFGVPKHEADPDEGLPRQGVVSYFDNSKGFGFINDAKTGERVFVHVNQLTEAISENDKVLFDVESGPRGLSACNVKKQPK